MSESILNLLAVSVERARNLLTKGPLAESPATMTSDVLLRCWLVFQAIRLAVEKAEKAVAEVVKALVLKDGADAVDPKTGAESKRVLIAGVEAVCSRSAAGRVFDNDAALPVALQVEGCVTYSMALSGLTAAQALQMSKVAEAMGYGVVEADAHVDETKLAAACTLHSDINAKADAAKAWYDGKPGAWRLTVGKATDKALVTL